ncbi:MAG: hypothetical protein AABY30_05925 [Candidatus Thermoplasmatota archaeon]
MGFEVAMNGTVREKTGPPGPMRTIACPRCGATNPATTKRCRACLTPLGAGAKPAPRTVTPVIDPRRAEVDAALGELEALTREEAAPAVRFQCPNCGRIVDEAATRCGCGAVFEPPADILGYECPLCGARVSANATRCACGARFSA